MPKVFGCVVGLPHEVLTAVDGLFDLKLNQVLFDPYLSNFGSTEIKLRRLSGYLCQRPLCVGVVELVDGLQRLLVGRLAGDALAEAGLLVTERTGVEPVLPSVGSIPTPFIGLPFQ